jgi:hypothetical protein
MFLAVQQAQLRPFVLEFLAFRQVLMVLGVPAHLFVQEFLEFQLAQKALLHLYLPMSQGLPWVLLAPKVLQDLVHPVVLLVLVFLPVPVVLAGRQLPLHLRVLGTQLHPSVPEYLVFLLGLGDLPLLFRLVGLEGLTLPVVPGGQTDQVGLQFQESQPLLLVLELQEFHLLLYYLVFQLDQPVRLHRRVQEILVPLCFQESPVFRGFLLLLYFLDHLLVQWVLVVHCLLEVLGVLFHRWLLVGQVFLGILVDLKVRVVLGILVIPESLPRP